MIVALDIEAIPTTPDPDFRDATALVELADALGQEEQRARETDAVADGGGGA